MKTPLDTSYDNAEDSPGLRLWQVSNKWQARQRAALKPFNLTHVQFVLLASLTYAQGNRIFTQKQLAEYAQTDVMMTSEVLRTLEGKGLVVRKPHETDGRAFTLTPTAEGISLVNQAIGSVEAVDREFFGTFEKHELVRFMAIMRAMLGR